MAGNPDAKNDAVNFDTRFLIRKDLRGIRLPKALQQKEYHLDGAPTGGSSQLFIYKKRIMDRYTASVLRYLEILETDNRIADFKKEIFPKITDDEGRRLFPDKSKKNFDKCMVHIDRIISKIEGEITVVTKDEIITKLYALLNEKKDVVVAGSIKRIKISPTEKQSIWDTIAEISGNKPQKGIGGLFPAGASEGKLEFTFKKDKPPGTDDEEYTRVHAAISAEVVKDG